MNLKDVLVFLDVHSSSEERLRLASSLAREHEAKLSAVFVSDGKPDEVRYRLTYTPTGKDTLTLRFEIAAPGKDFSRYLEASARRDR